ncbi:MAG: hypothetical protein P3W87_004455 [Gammaproteobacteria bacterium]|nr:hypothetical protein [Gammaproteobacteria bacterium]
MIPVHFKRTLDKRLEPLRQRFEALQPRERVLIIMVGMVLVWALAQVFYFNAAAMREKQLYRALSEAHQQISQHEATEQYLRVHLSERSLAVFESKRAELMRNRVELDEA